MSKVLKMENQSIQPSVSTQITNPFPLQ